MLRCNPAHGLTGDTCTQVCPGPMRSTPEVHPYMCALRHTPCALICTHTYVTMHHMGCWSPCIPSSMCIPPSMQARQMGIHAARVMACMDQDMGSGLAMELFAHATRFMGHRVSVMLCGNHWAHKAARLQGSALVCKLHLAIIMCCLLLALLIFCLRCMSGGMAAEHARYAYTTMSQV